MTRAVSVARLAYPDVRSALLIALLLVSFASDGWAEGLTGAWATSADQCNKVFVRKGRTRQVSFTNFSGVYGGGFIIEADQLRGKFVRCTIKNRKQDGETVNLIASCATDIMLSNVQFVLKQVNNDLIKRVFPGMDGVEAEYHRCTI